MLLLYLFEARVMVRVLVIATLILLSLNIAMLGIEAGVLVNKFSNSNCSVLQSGKKIILFLIITMPFKEGEEIGG